jgi:hypothetical protein
MLARHMGYPENHARLRAATVVVLAAVLAALPGCRPPPPNMSEPLSQRYPSRDGMVVAHYPASFAAHADGEHIVILAHNLSDGSDEAIDVQGIENPISTDVAEFGRVVHGAVIARLHEFREVSRTTTTCLGAPGVELIGTWTGPQTGRLFRRVACALVRNGHGYVYSYSVADRLFAERGPYLRRIVDATEILR